MIVLKIAKRNNEGYDDSQNIAFEWWKENNDDNHAITIEQWQSENKDRAMMVGWH